MIRTSIMLLGSALLVGVPASAAGEDKPAEDHPRGVEKKAAAPYEGYTADQALLRKHLIHKAKDGGKDTKASSAEACQAAQRIFSRVSLLFRIVVVTDGSRVAQ